MNVLVLGGHGFVGKEVVSQLIEQDSISPFIGVRRVSDEQNNSAIKILKIDSTNILELKNGLKNMDVVINCVTGDGHTIMLGAERLCQAAIESGLPRIIHLSSQSVYGSKIGCLTEQDAMQDDLGWYCHAKIMAEHTFQEYASLGGEVVILRPGCISGKNSPLWVERIIPWLQKGKLGDLGASGDGWSNLVDVSDVAQAVIKSISSKTLVKQASIYNLSAPDSPRWNQYFIDLGIMVDAMPIRRISHRSLRFRAYFFGVPVKIVEHIFKKIHLKASWLPQEVPPSLLKLFKQSIKLDSRKITAELDLEWTHYSVMMNHQVNQTFHKSKDSLER